MRIKIVERHKEITHIQNTIWAMYKQFLSDHDIEEYNRNMGKLAKEYADKGDKQLLLFCQNLLISWAPVVNTFAEEFRSGE